MTAARPGMNLWTKIGRKHWREFRFARRYAWRDTFGPLLCAVMGHKPYDANPGGTPTMACSRCCRFLEAK